MDVNKAVYGEGVEILGYEGKNDYYKLFVVDDTENEKHDEGTFNALAFASKIKPNELPDLSVCYVNVDNACPWTNYNVYEKRTNSISEQVTNNRNVSLYPSRQNTITTLTGSGQGSIDLRDSIGRYVPTGSDVRNFNQSCWINSFQKESTNTNTGYLNIFPASPGITPIVKFGGRAIVLQIKVYAGSSQTTTGTAYNLDTFCAAQYSTRPYITKITVVPQYKTQNSYLPLKGKHSDSNAAFIPIVDDHEFVISTSGDSSSINLSTWDLYAPVDEQIIFGFRQSNVSSATSTNSYSILIDNASELYASSSNRYSSTHWSHIAGDSIDSFKEYVMKSVAYFGLFFVTGGTIPNSYLDDNMYCGIIDEDGVTHGEYSNGEANAERLQFTAKNMQHDTNVTPWPQPKPSEEDPNAYIDTMPGHGSLSLASFTRLYAMDGLNIADLRVYLSKLPDMGDTLEDQQEYLARHYLNSNPLDNIVALRWFPFDVGSYVMINAPTTGIVKISNAEAKIEVGALTISASGTTSAAPTTLTTLYLGSFTPLKAFNSFLDYEPYSDAKLYLPYCGTTSIEIKYILGHTLYISYKIDVKSGSCTALVTMDSYEGKIVATGHGTISIDLPVTGIQAADFQNALYQGISALKSAQISQFTAYVGAATSVITAGTQLATTGAGAVGGAIRTVTNGIAAAAQSDIQAKAAEYNIDAAPIKHTLVGNSSTGDAALMYDYPALIVTRPEMLPTYDKNNYSRTVGNACIINTTLGSQQGFTVVSDIDLSGTGATKAEQEMILQMVQHGIII